MTEKTEVEEPSLADALAAEFDKQTAEPEKKEEKKVAAEKEPTKKNEEVETPEKVESEEVEKDLEAEADTDPEKEKVEVAPPEHWSDEDKQAFMAMDEGGREWALRLEKNAHKGIEEKSKELKKFRAAFEPYRHLIPAGVSEEQVIQNLLNAQSVLQRDPVEGIKWLMKSYGVDEKQFTKTSETGDDEYVDPDIRKLREELAQLKQGAESNARAAEQRRQQAMLAEIANFRDATDENGEALHPHFNDVQGVMAGLLTSGRAESMDDAYEKAVWAIPEYRDSVVEQRVREQAEKAIAEKAKKAETAKTASKSVQGKTSAKSKQKAETLGDALTDAYEKSIRGEL